MQGTQPRRHGLHRRFVTRVGVGGKVQKQRRPGAGAYRRCRHAGFRPPQSLSALQRGARQPRATAGCAPQGARPAEPHNVSPAAVQRISQPGEDRRSNRNMRRLQRGGSCTLRMQSGAHRELVRVAQNVRDDGPGGIVLDEARESLQTPPRCSHSDQPGKFEPSQGECITPRCV